MILHHFNPLLSTCVVRIELLWTALLRTNLPTSVSPVFLTSNPAQNPKIICRCLTKTTQMISVTVNLFMLIAHMYNIGIYYMGVGMACASSPKLKIRRASEDANLPLRGGMCG